MATTLMVHLGDTVLHGIYHTAAIRVSRQFREIGCERSGCTGCHAVHREPVGRERVHIVASMDQVRWDERTD
jgi:hypothetical protein